MTDAYSRLYHRFASEFPTIYADDRALATWIRLLLQADASWPMRPPIARSVRPKPLAQLVEVGLVTLLGDAYAVKGLDAERTRRREAARTGAAKRWQSDGNANASANAMPRRDETRLTEETTKIPPPPAERGRRANGTAPRSTGASPRNRGANPRAKGTSTRQLRKAEKSGPLALSTHELLRRAAAAGAPE